MVTRGELIFDLPYVDSRFILTYTCIYNNLVQLQ